MSGPFEYEIDSCPCVKLTNPDVVLGFVQVSFILFATSVVRFLKYHMLFLFFLFSSKIFIKLGGLQSRNICLKSSPKVNQNLDSPMVMNRRNMRRKK